MKTLADHILDIAQNSTRAGATLVQINVDENSGLDSLVVQISDNGCGMDADTLARARDPFFTSRTTRKVGLGIPLLLQNAEQTGGNVEIESQPGQGTVLKATFGLTHIDRPPWGDVASTVALLASGNPNTEFVYTHRIDGQSYGFDTREIKRELDGVPITHPDVVRFVTEMIKENLDEIGME